MKFTKNANIRLFLIGITFTIIFIITNNLFVNSILNKGIELTCNVHYNQICNYISKNIELLKNTTTKISNDNTIIDVLDKNRDLKNLDPQDKESMLKSINTFEDILKSSNFVNKINIVSLCGNYLFSNEEVLEDFDLISSPWFDNKSINNKDNAIITDIHKDFSTGLYTFSIISFVYSDQGELLGAVVFDIFVQDLLNYINDSFLSGTLNSYIIKEDNIIYSNTGKINQDINNLNGHKTYSIKSANNYLDNGDSLLFVFDKNSISDNSYMKPITHSTYIIILIISLFISIILVKSIQLAFKPALKAINKLKYILEDLDENEISFKNKNEFKQLELISDSLGKSFDKKIQSLIFYDELTKLPNRKKLKLICDEMITNKSSFALVFIDLDKFKITNDVFGHSVGDELLIKFGNIMKDSLGDRGIITRYSGDEFVFIYKNFISESEFIEYYKKNILINFKKPIYINDNLSTFIEFSTGVAVYPKDGLTTDELINKSDFIMYKNKKNKISNNILFFNDDIYTDMLYVETIKTELKYACEKNELELYYQPIYDNDAKIKKAEALIRWNSKKLGFIPPNEFIKYAEDTGDIIPIGYWVIENVCKFISENKPKIDISLNVSAIQLIDIHFVEKVDQILREYDIDHNNICFEITESAILQKKDIVFNNLKSLRERGIKLSLDDFGTGYSSFSYLRKYPLDILKIDKIFLDNATKNDFEIIKSISEISKTLNMKVVIEGVETKNQFNELKKITCDFFQGYYFSKPLNKSMFLDLIKDEIN